MEYSMDLVEMLEEFDDVIEVAAVDLDVDDKLIARLKEIKNNVETKIGELVLVAETANSRCTMKETQVNELMGHIRNMAKLIMDDNVRKKLVNDANRLVSV
jgi:hypothetical protein